MKLELNISLLLSKLILVIALGVIGGIYFTNGEFDDMKTGKELTLEKYTAGFDEYKKDLMDKDPSYTLGAVIMLMIFGGAILIYEVAALLFSLLIKLLLKPVLPGNRIEI